MFNTIIYRLAMDTITYYNNRQHTASNQSVLISILTFTKKGRNTSQSATARHST